MFNGRYGHDDLNRALMICGAAGFLVNILLGIFFPYSLVGRMFSFIGLVCIAGAMFRMLSRNSVRRSMENAAFLRFYAKVSSRLRRGPRAKPAHKNPTFEERRKYKYFLCTQCALRMRVPRGKGKLRITCTRCGNKFDMKS